MPFLIINVYFHHAFMPFSKKFRIFAVEIKKRMLIEKDSSHINWIFMRLDNAGTRDHR